METKPKPTATPYRVSQDPRATGDFKWAIMAEEGMPTVALIIQPGAGLRVGETPEQRAKANAEFICRACNSHAGLVAALILMKEELEFLKAKDAPESSRAGKALRAVTDALAGAATPV